MWSALDPKVDLAQPDMMSAGDLTAYSPIAVSAHIATAGFVHIVDTGSQLWGEKQGSALLGCAPNRDVAEG